MADDLPSDKLIDVGLGNEVSPRDAIATSFFLTFQKVTGGAVASASPPAETETVEQPPTAAEAPVQPVGPRAETPVATAESVPDLKDALMTASRQYIIPVNRSSDLYRYAQTNSLGEFLSAEFPLQHQGVEYRAQVYDKGIVYIKADGSGGVMHVDF
jgi:hypothetical protein